MDCDLRKLYYVDEMGNSVRATSGPDFIRAATNIRLQRPTAVLFEIAGAVDYTKEKGPGVAYNKRRWTIFNVGTATWLDAIYSRAEIPFFVATSSTWTRGFDLKTRHEMAGCKQKKKDLRECEAMLWFYEKNPEAWVPLQTFLDNL